MYSVFVLMLAVTVNSQLEPLDHLNQLSRLLIQRNQQGTGSKLTEVFRWKLVDFQFPNEQVRNSLIRSKRYIQANNSMLGLDVWRNKLFITVPRWYQGTGSTLNYVNLDSLTQSPLLIPYPDYESNDIYSGKIDDKIISATRVFVDSCNRLWVPDNGQDELFTDSPTVLAPQRLHIFDLTTNRLLRKVTIGKEFKTASTLIYEVIVDVSHNDCDNAYAYIADTIGYGLLVYSWKTNTLSRISNSYFYFEPQSSVFGSVQFPDGIMGMALSPVRDDGFRTFYFHALASYNEYNVSTQVLKDPKLSTDFTKFNLMGSRGERGQSTNQRLDETTGVVFYTQVLKNGIGCWNSKQRPFEYSTATNEMVAVDSRLSFPSSLTLDRQRNIWVLSNNLLSFGDPTFDPKKYNYFVLMSPVQQLLIDTVCNL